MANALFMYAYRSAGPKPQQDPRPSTLDPLGHRASHNAQRSMLLSSTTRTRTVHMYFSRHLVYIGCPARLYLYRSRRSSLLGAPHFLAQASGGPFCSTGALICPMPYRSISSTCAAEWNHLS